MDYQDIYNLALRELDIEGRKALKEALSKNIEQVSVIQKMRECEERMRELIPVAAKLFEVPEALVLDEDREHGLVICRQVIILKLYREGHSIRSISKAIGLSRSTILYSIDKMSVIVTSGSPSWKDLIQKWKILNGERKE